MAGGSPRDRYLTIYGRMPVLEALRSAGSGSPGRVRVAKVFVSRRASGPAVAEIMAAAETARVAVERVKEEMVTAVARNGRHHQGVAADLLATGLAALSDFLEHRHGRAHATSLLLLDGVHNPANVGMIVRTAVAAGLDGVVVPRRGTAELGPLVIKASAGVALSAPILRCTSAAEGIEQLVAARFTILGLAAGRPEAAPLFGAELPPRAVYVLGNEREGITPPVAERVERWLRIPLAGGVESLNVSSAATLVAFEVGRRRGVGAGGADAPPAGPSGEGSAAAEGEGHPVAGGRRAGH